MKLGCRPSIAPSIGRILFTLAVLTTGLLPVARAETPRIAIVIDDIGFQWGLDHRALRLSPEVAVSIIPEGPHASTLARRAAEQDREVWVHLPLAGLRHDNCQAGLTCMQSDWTRETMHAHLLDQLDKVPGAIGINNHQGSRFTADRDAVLRLVEAIGLVKRDLGQPLIVLDSRTVANSQLETVAREEGLSTLRRRVFLDHRNDSESIARAWQDLIDLAHYHGQAVAIGHPRELTLSFLEAALSGLQAEGIELVPPSMLAEQDARAVGSPLAP
ncbi:hypothetical protein AY599_06495 [Leptolyngbya valderiana BDU 20041]|nr:hypothetical protein AY599_06495 [Leptolyngbya valderiana BDU 20041]